MSRPNILHLMTDQHRWDFMGYMGHPTLQGLTPGFDRLAAEGAAFTRCYSVNPLCMPARHAIHTGLYTFQSGQMDNVGDWPMDTPTFTQALQKLGYHTTLTGKLHAHEAVGYDIDLTEDPWDAQIRTLGFDEVVQVSGKTMAFFTDDAYTHYLRSEGLLRRYREDIVDRTEKGPGWWPSVLPDEHFIDHYIGRRAEEWLRAYDGERPFFHMVSFCSPHPCFDACQSALERIDHNAIQLPANVGDPERYRDLVANYAALIHIVDQNVERLLDALEDRGWLDNTFVIFTADHGEMLGDSGKGGKCWWDAPSVRVPLLVRWPGWTGPRLVDETLVSCHDVAATILDLALGMGGDPSSRIDPGSSPAGAEDDDTVAAWLPGCSSRSLRPFLMGETPHARAVAYCENGPQFNRPWRSVIDLRHQYVYLLDTGEELLYDLAADPHGTCNLVSERVHAPTLHDLRRAMLREHVAHPAPKTGRAAYSPRTPHAITRERLERNHGQ